MKRATRKWLGRGLLVSIVLVVAAFTWLLGSSAGTRWILARTANWLPQALTIGEVEGSLLGGLRFERVGWRDESIDLSMDDFFLHVELQPLLRRQLRVEELEADYVTISLPESQDANAEFSMPEFEMPVRLSVAELLLNTVEINRDGQEPLRFSLGGSGDMRGARVEIESLTVGNESLSVDVSGNALLAIPHRASLRVRWRAETENGEFAGLAGIDGDSSRYTLTHELALPFAVSTSGSLSGVPEDLTVDIRNEWVAASWPIADEMLEARNGSLSLRGNLDSWDVVLETVARWGEVPETRLALEGTGNRERLSIANLVATSGDSRIEISGVTEWAPAARLQVDYDTPGLDLALLDPWFDIPFPMVPLRSSGSVDWTEGLLQVRDAEFAAGSNTLSVNGSFGDELDIDASFFLLAIGELFPEAAGTLQGVLTASGTPAALLGNATVDGTGLEWQQFSVGRLETSVQSLVSEEYVLDVELRDIVAAGTSLDSALVSLSGSITEHDAKARVALGDTRINANLSGGLAATAWQGTLSSLELENDAIGRWTSTSSAPLSASADRAELARFCLESVSGNACLQGEYSSDGPVSLDLALTDVPPRALPLPIPDSVRVGGTISANASGELLEGRISGSGTMQWNDAILEASVEGENLSARLSEAFLSATLADNRLTGSLQLMIADADATAATEFRMDNLFDTTSSIASQATLSVADAGVFAFLLPDLNDVSGSIDGRLSVGGSLQLPAVTGEVSLSDGTFRARQTGVQIRDLDLTLAQRAPGQLQLRGSASSGDGQIAISGDTLIGSDTGIRTDLRISGSDFEVARLPDFAVTASPDLVVVLDEQLTSITGELGIPRADIILRTLPDTAVSSSRDAVVNRAGVSADEDRRRRTDVDVTASLGEQVSFAGFGLTADIEGALRVRGGTHEPFVGAGRLALRNGRYKAYGQDLDIERGELIFNGPLNNPELDVRATRKAGDVTAGIRLSGTPANLQSEVFSEPVLSDAETLSYLLTGRPLGSSNQDGDTLNKAAFALGLSGAGKVASQVRAGLGLETLQIEGGADDGRIIAGKRFGSRLMVEYGYGIIDKLGTLLLRYQLNDRLVLESRTGTISNLDVVYSVKKQ